MVDSLQRAFEAGDSPVVKGPLTLVIDCPPSSGVEFYIAHAAFRAKRCLRDFYQEVPEPMDRESRRAVYLCLNPRQEALFGLMDVYEEMSNAPRSLCVIACDEDVVDPQTWEPAKEQVEEALSFSNIPYHPVFMRPPQPEDYVQAFRSLYAPTGKDVRAYGSADSVLEALGYSAFGLSLGIRNIPRSLEHAAIAYSGKRTPSLQEVMRSFADLPLQG